MQRLLGLVVAAALALLAVNALRFPDAVPTPQANPPGTTQPGPEPTEEAPSPADTGSATAADDGPGLTEPGILAVVQTDVDGNLEVMEKVRLTSPVSSLLVTLPHGTTPETSGAKPTITGFQAQAGDLVVTDTPASPLPAAGDRIDLPLPATEIVMRYRLEGGAIRSQPAPVGRALVMMPPITAADPALGDLPVVVQVVGGNIRNVVCPALDVGDQLCGRQNGQRWTTTVLPLSRASVVAQIDLPQPGQQ